MFISFYLDNWCRHKDHDLKQWPTEKKGGRWKYNNLNILRMKRDFLMKYFIFHNYLRATI